MFGCFKFNFEYNIGGGCFFNLGLNFGFDCNVGD